jgi:hypothetical protein
MPVHKTWNGLAKHIKKSVAEAIVGVKIELFSAVVMDTRVDTGRLRGNWQMSTNQPTTVEITRMDPSGNAVITDITTSVSPYAFDIMTNNLPYAEVWEERDGMIATNALRFESLLRKFA